MARRKKSLAVAKGQMQHASGIGLRTLGALMFAWSVTPAPGVPSPITVVCSTTALAGSTSSSSSSIASPLPAGSGRVFATPALSCMVVGARSVAFRSLLYLRRRAPGSQTLQEQKRQQCVREAWSVD